MLPSGTSTCFPRMVMVTRRSKGRKSGPRVLMEAKRRFYRRPSRPTKEKGGRKSAQRFHDVIQRLLGRSCDLLRQRGQGLFGHVQQVEEVGLLGVHVEDAGDDLALVMRLEHGLDGADAVG